MDALIILKSDAIGDTSKLPYGILFKMFKIRITFCIELRVGRGGALRGSTTRLLLSALVLRWRTAH